jgi:hypothetical protein
LRVNPLPDAREKPRVQARDAELVSARSADMQFVGATLGIAVGDVARLPLPHSHYLSRSVTRREQDSYFSQDL